MNFLFNSISELLIGIAQEAATYCMFISLNQKYLNL